MPYMVWCLIWATAAGLCDGIVLKDGGYEDINIVIQDKEPESEALLDAIKLAWTSGSATLFKATHQRIFFRKIKIIIPGSWSDQYATSTGPSISSLDSPIKVGSNLPHVPHVKGLVACGSPGQYMSLHTETLVGQDQTYGPLDQVIVHEWGHLRWGLFDEYPSRIDDRANYTHSTYFYLADGAWKPVVCTENIQVTPGATCDLSSSKMIEPTCNFTVDPNQDIPASLMGHQFLIGLTDFCDKNTRTNPVPEEMRHNADAPNKHNTMCGSRSVWEVLREHPDFSDGNSPKLGNNTNTDPEFEIYQESASVRVMVLDVSGSMGGERIGLLHQAATLVISDSNIIQNGSWLSLVQFSTGVGSVVAMTHVISDANRQYLISALPTGVSGSTCIGCGLLRALEILRSFLEQPENADIIVISDGGNNVGDLDAAIQEAVDAKVVVHTIAISQAADLRLETMSTRTGGKNLVFLGGTDLGVTSLAAAMSSVVVSSVTSESTSSVTIASEKIAVKAGVILSHQFALDSGVGKATSVSFLLQRSTEISVTLSGPNGFRRTESKAGAVMLLVSMNETESGNYDVDILTSDDTEIELYITSLPRDTVAGAIRTTSRLSHTNIDYTSGVLPVIYADVLQQGHAIVDANVTAEVETADQTPCTIQLYDDGQDPDATYNDGTYAGYIQRDCLRGNSRIGIKVHALGGANSKRRTDAFDAAFAFTTAEEEEVETATGNFERISLPGELTVTNYVVGDVADVTPPGRITDLEVADIFADGGNRNYTLKWTATGDDKSTGTAFGYEIRVADTLDDLLNNFTAAALLQLDSTVVPKASKLPEAVTIVVDATDSYTETAFCAIVAVDEAGNRGVISNVVSVVVATGYTLAVSVTIGIHPTVVPVVTTTADPVTTADPEVTVDPMDTGVDVEGSTITLVLPIMASVVVLLGVVIGVSVCVLCRRRVEGKKKKNKRVKEFQDIEEPPVDYIVYY